MLELFDMTLVQLFRALELNSYKNKLLYLESYSYEVITSESNVIIYF